MTGKSGKGKDRLIGEVTVPHQPCSALSAKYVMVSTATGVEMQILLILGYCRYKNTLFMQGSVAQQRLLTNYF